MRIRERGSVTVFFTAILIPTIILVSIFTDLSRIRFYNTQALMAADNYAEGVLTEYDNLLKELYGFFAVSQNEEGKAAIETIKKYMDSSFYVNKNSIEFGHLKRTMLNQPKTYEGFQAYSGDESAFTLMDYEPVEGANLGNYKVLGNQIGDFMKFRIVKEALPGNDSDAELLDMIEEVKSMESKMEVLKEKEKTDKNIKKLLDLEYEFTKILLKMDSLDDYLKNKNKVYQIARDGYHKDFYDGSKILEQLERRYEKEADDLVYETGTYDEGMLGIVNSTDYSELLEKEDSQESEVEESEKEEDDEEVELKKDIIKDALNAYVTFFKKLGDKADNYPVTEKNYASLTDKLTSLSKDIESLAGTLTHDLEKLEELANKEKDEEFRENFKETLDLYKKINENIGGYGETAKIFEDNKVVMEGFGQKIRDMSKNLEEIQEEILNGMDNKELPDTNVSPFRVSNMELAVNQFKGITFARDITQKYKLGTSSAQRLWENLEESFGRIEGKVEDLENSPEGKRAKDHKAAAERELKQEEEDASAKSLRNVPEGASFGSTKLISFDSGIFKDLYQFFKNEANDAPNGLLLKLYTLYYDVGMFTDRVDAYKHKKNPSETKISMTGFDMAKLNYLYGAEIEYLCGGYKNSQSNLNSVRNKILAFRGITNLISTFAIKEVNSAINAASSATGPFAPLVNAVIRLGITVAESAADWKSLKEDGKVVLLKKRVDELETIDLFLSVPGKMLVGGTIAERLANRTARSSHNSGGSVQNHSAISSRQGQINENEQTGSSNGQNDEQNSGLINSKTDFTKNSKVDLTKKGKVDLTKKGKVDLTKNVSSQNAHVTIGKSFEINYKQCLAVIAFLFVSTEKLISRTGDLVSLNVNHHIVGGDFNELQFKMENAHTAVKATSEVGMKFLLLPDGFGMSQSEGYEGLRDFTKATISKGTYLKMKEFEKNKYKYSIIRGY